MYKAFLVSGSFWELNFLRSDVSRTLDYYEADFFFYGHDLRLLRPFFTLLLAQEVHKRSYFKLAETLGIPCVGFGEGGVSVSEMSGAKVIPFLSGHKQPHALILANSDKEVYKNTVSLHGSGIDPWATLTEGADFDLLAFAEKNSGAYRDDKGKTFELSEKYLVDPEVVHFINNDSLAILGMPEYDKQKEVEKFYRETILNFIKDEL